MFCILITGSPASGKSTLARHLSAALKLPTMSKDRIKELLFDTVGFRSREEKVNLGEGSRDILYYFAECMMQSGQSFILENNFEKSARAGIARLLMQFDYTPVTLCLTASFPVLYARYAARSAAFDRHPGHAYNTCFPPSPNDPMPSPVTYEQFSEGVNTRGMLDFNVGGKRIEIDTTDFRTVNYEAIEREIREYVGLPCEK